RQWVPFYWSSVQALWLAMLGCLPLVERLAREGDGWTLLTRVARRPWEEVLAVWLGTLGYGCTVLAIGAAVSYTVERILSTQAHLPASCLVNPLSFLLATSALTPAVRLLPWSTSSITLGWIVVSSAVLCHVGPSSAEPENSLASDGLRGIVSTVLASAGGLVLSLALRHYRLRN
ncbi:MAG: hypothetical protein KDC87_16095, partial [Planctomycetes bacterium]|nr:hypothetical protein [Planctomycetota bacterium]